MVIAVNSHHGLASCRLKVERLSSEKKEELVVLLRNWFDYANEQMQRAGELEDLQSHALFQSSVCVLLGSGNDVQDFDEDGVSYWFRCITTTGDVVGLMQFSIQEQTVENKQLEIHWLMTNPAHLRSPLNAQVMDRVSGVGSALVQVANQFATSNHVRMMKVRAYEAARGFYERCGFVNDPPNQLYRSTIFMVKSVADRVFDDLVADS